MTDTDLRSFIKSERLRLVYYIRSLLRETADMDAEDVVHDVLAKILEKADPTTPLENLAAYVYRSLKNRVIDSIRTKKPTVSLDSAPDEESGQLVGLLRDLAPSALEALQTQEGKEGLFQTLEELRDMEREVIIAHEFEGVPFKGLSYRWNVPQNTLLSHKSRAIKKLRQHFQRS